jgi:pimeloyl-ACP methyl ester carboxylesterase
MFSRRVSRKAAWHSEWRLGLAVVVVVAALAISVLSLLWAAAESPSAPISRRGIHNGAPYRIEVPAGWNGKLVVFAHGYEGEGSGQGSVHTSPRGTYLTRQGYAWAASGYRSRGYRPDWFVADTLAVRELFIRDIGLPHWTIIHGMSMGGHVAMASLELYPGVYQGALIECGVIDGISLGDLHYAWRVAAAHLSGVNVFEEPDRQELARRVHVQWLPLMGAPGSYTERGRRYDSVMKYLMGGDLPLRLQGLEQRYLANLLFSPEDIENHPLHRAASTLHIRYRIDPGLGVTEEELNAQIRRKSPAPGARSQATDPVFAELTGQITVPVLALHETGDARVPFSLQQMYRRRTLTAGTAYLLVQWAVRWPGHCTFPGEVREQAFDNLGRWIEEGSQPDGDNVLASDVSQIGLRWTPLLHVEDPLRH